jgi:polar amino acid transport system substrate-binding protein
MSEAHHRIRSAVFKAILLVLLTASYAAALTAPRFGPKLFQPEETIKILAYQYPPLIDAQTPGMGIAANIVQAAFEEVGIDMQIEILPVKSLARHSLLHENAVAVLGEPNLFSKTESGKFRAVPCYQMTGGYYYYLPAHREGMSWNGDLKKLRGYTGGVPTGENVALYKNAGIKVVQGDLKYLLRKLKEREIDFLSAPDIVVRRYIQKSYSDEINNFALMKGSAWTAPFSLFFNKRNLRAETLRKAYSEGLKKIKQNGKYDRILSIYEEKGPPQISETYVSAGAPGIIEFGSSDTPPFWSPVLPGDGMAGEILHALFAEINMSSRIIYFPLKRLQTDLRNNHLGDPDNFTGQRFRAIIPIALYRAAFFYYKPRHKEGMSYRKMEDLSGYTIGVIRGTLENKGYFDKNVIKVTEANNEQSLFRQLKEGRIDLCGVIRETGEFTIKKEFPGEVDNFVPMEIPNSFGPVSVMIDWNYPDGKRLGAKIDAGLKRIIKSGVYLQILEKYLGKGNVPVDWFIELEKFRRKYQQT